MVLGTFSSLKTVYPRAYGAARGQSREHYLAQGLSPRIRGSPTPQAVATLGQRSIPAHTGHSSAAQNIWVYPRVDGAASSLQGLGSQGRGLSPRGRGSRGGTNRGRRWLGSIPAWTGQPSKAFRSSARSKVYPRVDGAATERWISDGSPIGLSPRGRGSHYAAIVHGTSLRSIPAWTGQPHGATLHSYDARVYPRVDGAAKEQKQAELLAYGLSPRGRGSPARSPASRHIPRSIPAWTGQPLMKP